MACLEHESHYSKEMPCRMCALLTEDSNSNLALEKIRTELSETRKHLQSLVQAYFNDTGAEPSVSVHGRAASDARHLLETQWIDIDFEGSIDVARRMRNEIVGLCSLGEHHIREIAGNTNYQCLVDAVKEFDAVSGTQK